MANKIYLNIVSAHGIQDAIDLEFEVVPTESMMILQSR